MKTISFSVTVKPICAFVFASAKCLFSHDAANISVRWQFYQVIFIMGEITFIWAFAWENQQFGFPTRFDTNRPVQSHNKARSLKFWISVKEELYRPWSENKFADQLCSNCVFVFAYAIFLFFFSDAMAHFPKNPEGSTYLPKTHSNIVLLQSCSLQNALRYCKSG